MKEIEIKDKSGLIKFSTPANIDAKGKFLLMQEDYIILPFSVKEPVSFKMGDYVDLSETLDESLKDKFGKIYEIVDKQNPVYNSSTGGYDYQLRLDAYYWKWKNKIFRYTPENTASEASWSLTAALDVQLGVFLRNLKALGYTYRGADFTFSIDDSVENKAVAMTYDNMNLLDALFSMAGEDKWNCDCWITDNVIHFGRCEFGDAVKIERDVEAASVSRTESNGDYGTRIIAFGSTSNIPTNYRKKFIDTISFIQGDLRFTGKLSNTNYYLEQDQRTDIRILTGVDAGKTFNVRWDSGNFYFESGVTCNASVGDKFEVLNYSYKVPDRYLSYGADDFLLNGVVQRRLMLPEDTPYIDLYEGMTDDEAVEKIITFDDVFPRMDGVLSDVHTRTEEVENEDGTKETVTYYRYKDENLNFREEYKLDEKLRIKFQSGLLNGLEFEVLFNPLPKDENRGEQLWEIVLNENYGRRLPDDVMYPANGDKYVLLGFDTRYVSTLYIPAAEQELKEKTQKYVELIRNNDGTFPVTLKSTWVHENISSRLYGLGQRINLVDDTYFENGRFSRVLGYEINLDYPWDSPIYTIGESSSYSRIQELEDKVDALVYKGQTYVGTGGSGGANVYIIKSNDTTQPSDGKVFSALKSLITFLRKDQADTMPYLLTLLKGAVFGNSAASIDDKGVARLAELIIGSVASIDTDGLLTAVKAILKNIELSGDLKSDDFLAGALGTGYALIKRDADGKSYFEVDKLFARVKAIFAVLEIMKVTYTGGNFVFSPAGMDCTKVEEYDEYYRCYFTADDGEKAVENTFEVDDLVQLREFNVKPGVYENVSNRYFWRRCIAKGDDYIDLSKTDRDMTSDDAPMAGDDLVTIGNKTIKSRQNVIIISVYGEGSPSIIQYEGINDYTLDGKAKTVISPNGNRFTGSFLFESGSSVEDALGDLNNKVDSLGSIYSIDLTNEVSGVAANYDGTVTGELPYTDINVFAGNVADTGWVFAAEYSGCEGTIEGSRLTITALTEDTATATITATKEGVSTTLTAIMNIYKVRAGREAKPVAVVKVTASSQVFKKSIGSDGYADFSPKSITLTANLTNTEGTEWLFFKPETKDWIHQNYDNKTEVTIQSVLLLLFMTAYKTNYLTIRCQSGDVYDDITIYMVEDGTDGTNGEDAYTIILDNEAHTFAGNTTSALESTTQCGITAYVGSTQKAVTIGTPSNVPIGMSYQISGNGTTSAVILFMVDETMTTKNGVVDIPVTVEGKTFTKGFSYSLSLQGENGEPAVLYSIIPSATQVIKSTTGTLTPASLTCEKYKTIGNGAATVTTEKTLKYQRLGVDSAEVAYSGAVAVTDETKSVVFSLYDGSTLLDRENVPVLSDASDLVVGIRNLAIYSTCLLSNMTKDGYELTQITADTRDFFNFHILSYDKTGNYKSVISKNISETGIYSYVIILSTDSVRLYIKANGAIRDTGVSFYNDFKANTQYTITLEITNITQGSFSWKNVMITEGNKQVDFTPAPEDIDQQIEDTLNSSKTYTDSKIEATEEKISLEVSKVQINTRNLVKNGEFKISGSTSYRVKDVDLYVPLVKGQKYTIVSKAVIRGSQRFLITDSIGSAIQLYLEKDETSGLYEGVFTYNPKPNVTNNSILFAYNYPSSTAADNPMDIEWFCLYEGEVRVPQDFNPSFEDAAEYTDAQIAIESDNITSTVSKWIEGGGNLITNTYWDYQANGTSTSTSANYLTNNWYILPKCAGKSIVTAVKVKLSGCTLTSSSKIYVQTTNEGGWNYQTLCSKATTSNTEYVITGIYTAPSSLTANCPIRIRFDYIKGGTITISELRSYIADSIEPLLPWEPSEGDMIAFDSKIQQNADSISLKVQELVTGTGGNILYNSSFNTTTTGWGNAGDITYVGGGYGTKVTSPIKYLNQNVKNRILNKSVGTVYTISFDIYKPSTLKVLNVRLQANGTANDTNPVDLSDVPAYTWTRIVTHQTIKDESECELLVFGNSTTGNYTDSTGTYYVRYVKLEVGSEATEWSDSVGGLLATGIDIQNKKLIFTADNTVIQDNSGNEIAMFTVKDGKPLLSAENIDVENISVKKLETSNQVYEDLSYKMMIDAETSTFAMSVKDASGEYKALDVSFGQDLSGQTLAEMLFNRYSGSSLLSRTQINRDLVRVESYHDNQILNEVKATSEYVMVKDYNEDYPNYTHQDSIKIGYNSIEVDSYTFRKSYSGATQSVAVSTPNGTQFLNFIRGVFVSKTSSAVFPT